VAPGAGLRLNLPVRAVVTDPVGPAKEEQELELGSLLQAQAVDAALDEIAREAGAQFDPAIAGEFASLVRELRSAA
jgi:hypothetical protein